MAFFGISKIDPSHVAKLLRRSRVATLIVFAAVTVVSYQAQAEHRPITSALVYLMCVMLIGASRGLRSGLAAGFAASCIYSIFIRNPIFEFGTITLDYYAPLFGFNFAALISGILAGRLTDRAESAEAARHQLDLLVQFSSALQKAVHLEDVAIVLRSIIPQAEIRSRLLPYVERARLGAVQHNLQKVIGLALAVPGAPPPDRRFEPSDIDLPAFVDLLAMAVERCDLLEQKAETEAVQRSEQLKTTILSSLSHDLRTPIAAISASAASLKRFGPSFSAEVRAEMLQTIEEQCTRLDRFIAKLLSFGRLQGGDVAGQLEPVDVVELLGKAVISARAAGPNHPIFKELPDYPVTVMANPAMLEQVFFNILENAVVYTQPGSAIRIQVEAAGGKVVIRIRDNGKGVGSDNLNNIFEPFFRSKSSQNTNGQGLGLFIARGFVEAFEGKIEASSPHPGGSGLEISIILPLVRVELEDVVNG